MPPNASNGTESAAIQKDCSENRTLAQLVIYSHLSISRPSKVMVINEKRRQHPVGVQHGLLRAGDCPGGLEMYGFAMFFPRV